MKALLPVILQGVALAMAVAVVVLSVLGALEEQTGLMMLGIGLFCLALHTMTQNKTEENDHV